MSLQTERRVHFFFNSKGGVGKSHNAVLLAQWHKDRGSPYMAFDADATSATFSSFPALNVSRIELMDRQDINPRQFDHLATAILDPGNDCHFVIDTGASSFVAINRYSMQMQLPQLISGAGKRMVANMMIVAGNLLPETIANLRAMVEQMPDDVEIIVWINNHFGHVVDESGRSFSEMPIYQQYSDRIAGIIELPSLSFTDPMTFGEDIKKLMSAGLTFSELKNSEMMNIIEKSRLTRLQTLIYEQFDAVLG